MCEKGERALFLFFLASGTCRSLSRSLSLTLSLSRSFALSLLLSLFLSLARSLSRSRVLSLSLSLALSLALSLSLSLSLSRALSLSLSLSSRGYAYPVTREYPRIAENQTQLPRVLLNVQRFRGGLVFKAHRLLYHSTLGVRVIKKKKKVLLRGGNMLPEPGRLATQPATKGLVWDLFNKSVV